MMSLSTAAAVSLLQAGVSAMVLWSCISRLRHRITNIQHLDNLVALFSVNVLIAAWKEVTAPGGLALAFLLFHLVLLASMRFARYSSVVMETPIPGAQRVSSVAIGPEYGRIPRRLHHCRVAMIIRLEDSVMESCACGAVRYDGRHWLFRNQRRRWPAGPPPDMDAE